jgi:nitrate reductase alpha subunit
MGRNGGGWAHYVGQEKCRPATGWATMAMATDWQRPPRQMIGTAYWYTHTNQWRYDGYRADALTSPLARGHLAGMHTMDTIALSRARRRGGRGVAATSERVACPLARRVKAVSRTVQPEVGQIRDRGGWQATEGRAARPMARATHGWELGVRR